MMQNLCYTRKRFFILCFSGCLCISATAQREVRGAFKKYVRGDIEKSVEILDGLKHQVYQSEYYYVRFLCEVNSIESSDDFGQLQSYLHTIQLRPGRADVLMSDYDFGEDFTTGVNNLQNQLYASALDYCRRNSTLANWSVHNDTFAQSPFFEVSLEEEARCALRQAHENPNELLERVVVDYPGTAAAKTAELEWAKIEFEKAERSNEFTALLAFGKKFPNSEYTIRALELAQEMHYAGIRQDNLTEVEAFLNRHEHQGNTYRRAFSLYENLVYQSLAREDSFDFPLMKEYSKRFSGLENIQTETSLRLDSMCNASIFEMILGRLDGLAKKWHYDIQRSPESYGFERVQRMIENGESRFVPYREDIQSFKIASSDGRIIPGVQGELIVADGGSFFRVLNEGKWKIHYLNSNSEVQGVGVFSWNIGYDEIFPCFIEGCLIGYNVDGRFINVEGNLAKPGGQSLLPLSGIRRVGSSLSLNVAPIDNRNLILLYDDIPLISEANETWVFDIWTDSGRKCPRLSFAAHDLKRFNEWAMRLMMTTDDVGLTDVLPMEYQGISFWHDESVLAFPYQWIDILSSDGEVVLENVQIESIALPGELMNITTTQGVKIVLDSLGNVIDSFDNSLSFKDVEIDEETVSVQSSIFAVDEDGGRVEVAQSFDAGFGLSAEGADGFWAKGVAENAAFDEKWDLYGHFFLSSSIAKSGVPKQFVGWCRKGRTHYHFKTGFETYFNLEINNLKNVTFENMQREEWSPRDYEVALLSAMTESKSEGIGQGVPQCRGVTKANQGSMDSPDKEFLRNSEVLFFGECCERLVSGWISDPTGALQYPVSRGYEEAGIRYNEVPSSCGVCGYWTGYDGVPYGSRKFRQFILNMDEFNDFKCEMLSLFQRGEMGDFRFSELDFRLQKVTRTWSPKFEADRRRVRNALFSLWAIGRNLGTVTQALSEGSFAREDWFVVLQDLVSWNGYYSPEEKSAFLNFIVEEGGYDEFDEKLLLESAYHNFELENWEKSAVQYREWIELTHHRIQTGDDDVFYYQYIRALNSVGHVSFELKDYSQAKDDWLTALDLARNYEWFEFWESGNIFINIGAAWANLGDQEKMCEYYLLAKGSGSEAAIERAKRCE